MSSQARQGKTQRDRAGVRHPGQNVVDRSPAADADVSTPVLDPTRVISRLAGAPPTARARVINRWQRQVGNTRVQRIIGQSIQTGVASTTAESASPSTGSGRTDAERTLDVGRSNHSGGLEVTFGAADLAYVRDPEPGLLRFFSVQRADTDTLDDLGAKADTSPDAGSKLGSFDQGSKLPGGFVGDPGSKLGGGADTALKTVADAETETKPGATGAQSASAPLTRGQVAEARNWYAAKRSTYTPEIIKKIQTEVGADPDGVVGTQTIQAVATYQQAHPPLSVDGIAGPRTMPALFPVGLAQESEEKAYVKEAKQVQADWAKLSTGPARAKALADLINKHLAAAGVPQCKDVVKDIGPAAGQFDFTTWTLELGQGPFSAATITNEAAADIADTVYHEARHAEQWFMMAQLQAGKGLKAKAIADSMSIPPAIAAAAVANPLKKGSTEAIEAEGWFESVYGARSSYRDRVLTDVEAKATARDKAKKEFDKNPTPANKAKFERAQAQFAEAHKRYTDLPEEADAFRVGDAVTADYLKDTGK